MTSSSFSSKPAQNASYKTYYTGPWPTSGKFGIGAITDGKCHMIEANGNECGAEYKSSASLRVHVENHHLYATPKNAHLNRAPHLKNLILMPGKNGKPNHIEKRAAKHALCHLAGAETKIDLKIPQQRHLDSQYHDYGAQHRGKDSQDWEGPSEHDFGFLEELVSFED